MRVVGLIARLLELGAAVALCALLFVSAGREDGRVSVERLSDIVPIKVVVSDFASLDDGGTHALYRIRGSAMLKVPVDRAEIVDLGNGAVAVKRIPVPSVDDRSVRFEPGGVELLDAERGWFTTVSGAAKKHDRLFSEARDAIRDAVDSPEVVQQARSVTEKIVAGFYRKMGRRVASFEWTAPGEGGAK